MQSILSLTVGASSVIATTRVHQCNFQSKRNLSLWRNVVPATTIRRRFSKKLYKFRAVDDSSEDIELDLSDLIVGEGLDIDGLEARARDGQQVAVHYLATAQPSGETVQTTWDRPEGPMIYTLGSMQGKPSDTASARILKTIDMALLGMKEGSVKKVTLSPTEAYGEKDPALVTVIPMAAMKQALGLAAETLKKGDNILLPDGRKAIVQDISETSATVDLNHPVAGMDVEFEITLMEIGEVGQIMDCQKGLDLRLARVSHILVEDEAACLELKVQLDTGLDEFANLASQHSKCASAAEGGSLGTIQAGMTVPEFDKEVFDESVEPGTVVGPVKTDFGYHLILVHERVSS